jgi:hypothetical protein
LADARPIRYDAPVRTDLTERIQSIAEEIFDKKLEDLDEHELREVGEIEELFRAEGRVSPIAHARRESWGSRRRSSTT